MEEILFFLVAFIISYIVSPKTLRMLEMGGIMKRNYQGKSIPVAAGIIFSVVLALTYAFLGVFSYLTQEAYVFLGLISLVSLAGFIDDVAGNREKRGFFGHFSYFFKDREFTTGIWKAGVGGTAALLAALTTSFSWWHVMLNALLIALMTNIFNLFDVYPGRSIKIFFLAALGIVILIPSYTANILLYPLIGAVAAYAVFDFQGKAMMGDTGSNLLGLAVGLAVVAGGSWGTRMIIVMVLIILHLVSERYSFSQIINNNRVLLILDRLGRRD